MISLRSSAIAGNRFYQFPISISQLKSFYVGCSGNGKYDSYKDHTGTAYVVPAGKKLLTIGMIANSGSTAGSWNNGYGDASVADSATPPTNAKTMVSEITAPASATANGGTAHYDVLFETPAGKYPYMRCDGSGASNYFHIIAIEVSA